MGRISKITLETTGAKLTPREAQLITAIAQLRIDLTRGYLTLERGKEANTPQDDRLLAKDAAEFIELVFPDLKIRVTSGIG
jgi:hypothetical protein